MYKASREGNLEVAYALFVNNRMLIMDNVIPMFTETLDAREFIREVLVKTMKGDIEIKIKKVTINKYGENLKKE